ncbi:MAG: MarR family winged helix-turn-helix transcriptional regulator [Peptococcaceae bacterium]
MTNDNSIALISRIREKVNKFLLAELKAIGLHDIAPSHGDIFIALFRYQELSMTEIADYINRDRSTVTTLVTKLINSGYAASRRNTRDGRSNLIFLTEKGRKFEKNFAVISRKLLEIEYRGVSEEERKVFLHILHKVYDNFH